jgi:hypothetical protein
MLSKTNNSILLQNLIQRYKPRHWLTNLREEDLKSYERRKLPTRVAMKRLFHLHNELLIHNKFLQNLEIITPQRI